MSARILCAADVAGILRVTPAEVLDMVTAGHIPALAVACGDALISEAALRELIDHSWVERPWEGLS